uniref:Uncharacterized protein n=1 Tax=Sciurus vulgaris TaxID=55149 RepID=A0A8D2D3L1_SCIVU
GKYAERAMIRDRLWSGKERTFGVKQIMEEAVTCKFVHEDSSHIISFCGHPGLHWGITLPSTWACLT